MAVTCTAANLMELSKCFQGLTKPQLEAIKAYLLAVQAGVEPVPGDLITAAKCFTGLSIPQLKAIQTYLLCQIANITPPVGETDGLIWGPSPETAGTLDGSFDSLLIAINSSTGESYTTLSFGNPTNVTGDVNFNSTSAVTSLTFRLLETIGGEFTVQAGVGAPILETLIANNLTSIGGNFDISDHPVLVTLGFDSLVTVVGSVGALNMGALTNFTLPALQTCDQVDVSGGGIEVLSLPSLTTYPPTGIIADASLLTLNLPACTDDGGGQLNTDLANMTGLVTLNLASVVTITANLTLSGSPNLSSFTANAWVPTDTTTIDFNGCSLDITSVELILRRLVLAGVVACAINLSGGTNAGTASLSAQGQADVATLGAQVTMNP